ncbi:Hsp20/alpha crystallin family protein [Exilibacterium tricleocarpae]|nr:Hsp20/alpha crystallin family protein [Exilibacterium tricleocarpae]
MTTSLSALMKSLLRLDAESHRGVAWQPLADIYRGENEWLLKVELAGVRAEDLQLRPQGRRLLLRGLRRDQLAPCIHISQSMEIAYNRFERVFDFAFDVEAARIETEYRDGMLYIHLRVGDIR